MKKEWGGPFLVKGVLTAEDARHALDIGADGVVEVILPRLSGAERVALDNAIAL